MTSSLWQNITYKIAYWSIGFFAHTELLNFAVERVKLTGVELDRLGGSVAAFTNLYLPRLHRAHYAAPNLHPENWDR